MDNKFVVVGVCVYQLVSLLRDVSKFVSFLPFHDGSGRTSVQLEESYRGRDDAAVPADGQTPKVYPVFIIKTQ